MDSGSDRARPELLRQSEERYRLLIESVKDYAIFLLDPDGRVATWNTGAERIKGYTADEIVGRHFSVFYPPEDVAAGKTATELRAAEIDGRFEDEGWRVRKDGSKFWADVVIAALFDDAGVLRGFAKVTRDLTERKRAEEQARQLAAAEVAREVAQTASHRKDGSLSMFAHELRNPLAPILTCAHLLRQTGLDPATRADCLDRLERQARYLSRLVDDMLEASRVARGRVTLRPERLDLARLTATAAGDRRPLFEKAGLALAVEVPATPVWVTGDPARLTQVVTNLLDNATKFTDRGGRVTVRVAADPAAGRAVLTVRDTGVGLPADLLPRLFEPFSQAERTPDRPGGGLGLGLSVVKGLVELHGGEVSAASEGPGRGAEFTVRLPLEPEPAALSAPPAPPAAAGGALRVLVIEDHRDAADSLRMLLEMLGHQTRVAYTGPEGVREAVDWGPDVVISDIGLPGMDGYGVARELRLNPVTARLRLLALTGYGSEDDRRRAEAAGFDRHLTKPVAPDVLLKALKPEPLPGRNAL
jgi:PAS domain S-box-containing protein